MNWTKLWTVCLVSLISFQLHAGSDDHWCYDCACELCTDWTASLDWIIWKTRTDNALPYDGTNAIGSVKCVDPDYESGVRLGLEKACGCYTFGAHYTRYHPEKSAQVTDFASGNLAGTRIVTAYNNLTQGSIERARANWDLEYDDFDLVFSQPAFEIGCTQIDLVGGLKFAFIDQQLNTQYFNQGAFNWTSIQQSVDVDAYGLTLGSHAESLLCPCWTLYANLSYDLYVADVEQRYHYFTRTDNDGEITQETRANLRKSGSRILGTLNVAIGTRYELPCWCGVVPHVGFGYEYHQWFNTPGFFDHQNTNSLVGLDRHQSCLSFDGFFLRFGAAF